MKLTVISAAIIAGAWLAWSWVLMVTLGIVHLHWWHLVPPMGWATAMILAAISTAVRMISAFLGELVKAYFKAVR